MSDLDPPSIAVEFDTSLYRLNAIKKAAYKFGDRCHIQLEAVHDTRVKVTLKAKQALANIQFLAGEFRNEVLDQDLREVVAQETEGVRNLLLAQAFSATSLVDPLGESATAEDDPLAIRSPEPRHEAQDGSTP